MTRVDYERFGECRSNRSDALVGHSVYGKLHLTTRTSPNRDVIFTSRDCARIQAEELVVRVACVSIEIIRCCREAIFLHKDLDIIRSYFLDVDVQEIIISDVYNIVIIDFGKTRCNWKRAGTKSWYVRLVNVLVRLVTYYSQKNLRIAWKRLTDHSTRQWNGDRRTNN